MADPADVGALVEEEFRGLSLSAVACAPERVRDLLGCGSYGCGDEFLHAVDLS